MYSGQVVTTSNLTQTTNMFIVARDVENTIYGVYWLFPELQMSLSRRVRSCQLRCCRVKSMYIVKSRVPVYVASEDM
jgi:hypothetical protein